MSVTRRISAVLTLPLIELATGPKKARILLMIGVCVHLFSFQAATCAVQKSDAFWPRT